MSVSFLLHSELFVCLFPSSFLNYQAVLLAPGAYYLEIFQFRNDATPLKDKDRYVNHSTQFVCVGLCCEKHVILGVLCLVSVQERRVIRVCGLVICVSAFLSNVSL